MCSRFVLVIVACLASACAHDVVRISSGPPVTLPARIAVARRAPPPSEPLPSYASEPACHALFGRGPRYDDYERCDGKNHLDGPWASVFTVPEFLFLLDGGDHAELHP